MIRVFVYDPRPSDESLLDDALELAQQAAPCLFPTSPQRRELVDLQDLRDVLEHPPSHEESGLRIVTGWFELQAPSSPHQLFGLADRARDTAIVSLCPIETRDHVQVAGRAARLLLHEVGHLRGLEHCEESSCAMFPSTEPAGLDQGGVSLCNECREQFAPAGGSDDG